MEKYEKYKDSGIEWIGEIPEHWEIKRLKYMGYLYGGLAGKSSNHFNQISNSNNKPFIPFTNICNNIVIDPNQMQYVVIEDGEKQNKVQEGDLFFMMSSENFDDVGKSSILLHDLGETYLNSFCKGFRFTNDSYYPSFINYLLLSKPFRSLVLTEANGYTRINLKIDKINDIPVIYPTNIEEQTHIATFLDRKTAEIDRIIANKQKLIALYEEEKQAIINQAVTASIQENVIYKKTSTDWLDEIPDSWQFLAMKRLVSTKITDGPHETPEFFPDGVPFLSAESVKNGKLDFDFRRGNISKELDEIYSKKCKPKRDDIFIVKSGSTTGKIAIVDFDDDFNIWSPLALIRVNEKVKPYFLYYALQSFYFQKQIQLSWSFGTQPNIGMNVIENLKVAVPISLEEQESIISHIEAELKRLNEIIVKFNKQIGLLKEYRTTLISEVVTGKIMVTENENK